jgi:formate-dependent nitrite reductase cytochrome c552 subunit
MQAMRTDNCIDCHMPKQESQVMTFQTAGKTMAQSYRTHTIGIY